MSRQTKYHRHLRHLVALTDANLSAVLLCHTVNIPARYKHRMIALSIRTTTLTDVSARMSRQTNYHQSLKQLVAPTKASLLAVLFCHTVNISARYKHCKIVLSIRTTILTDVSARMSRQTNYHRPLGHHVAPSDVILSAVLLCHMVNIPVRYKHHKIALSIRTTIVTDVSARISWQTNYHRHLGHLVVPTDVNLSAVLLCDTVNIPVRYKHRKIALSIRTTIVTDVSARISWQTNYHQHLGHLVAPTNVNLSAVLLCHTVNIPARYKHCKIALSIRTTIVTDVLARISQQGYLVALTNVNLSAVLLCHTVNIPARYKHCKIALSIRTTIVTDVLVRISRQTNYHRHLGHLVVLTDVNLSAVLLCQTVNIPVRYKHCKIA